MTERMLAALARLPVTLFAIDEAHCISQWGPSFRPEYADLCRLRELFPVVPIAALTATADEVTREDIADKLFAGAVEPFVLGFDRPNISLAVERKDEWKRQLLRFVARHPGESGIVYCLSRKKTEETAALLAATGVRALPYHAGMEMEARDEHQNVFMTEPGVVIVATIAFGMGIDKADVRYVFHTDLPGSVEAYYQELGRAGRDGAPAEAHMLYGLADIRMRRQFIESEDAGEDRKRREHHRLDALLGYCEASACRRVTLLEYFGERIEPCGNCDVCDDPSGRVDATEDARKVLSAAERSGERFGAAHLVDILRGAETEKIARFGHRRLPAFGTGEDRGKNEWRSMIRQMVATGFLRLDIAGYGGLGITDKGRALIRGEGEFLFREDRVITSSAARATRARPGTAEPERPLDGDEEALLNVLKALAPRARPGTRRPRLCRVPRPGPRRHDAAPATHRGGVRRGPRGRRGEAQAVRGAVPRRHREPGRGRRPRDVAPDGNAAPRGRMTLSTISSVVREDVGQVRVMAHGDIGRVVRGPARTGGGEKTVPDRFVPLGGKEITYPLANEL